MGRLLEILFPVRQGERRLTLLLLLHNLFAVGAFVAGRSVRDALFLTHADRSNLPWMYVASAASVAVIGLVYAPLAARVRRDRMAQASSAFLAIFFGVAWLAERRALPFIYEVLYVYVEVMGALVLVQFWTLANELFHAREAKRLYGLIGSGGTAANILIGLTTAKIATHFGASAILWLCAFLLIGCAFASALAGRVGRQRMFARAASGRPSPKNRVSGGMSRVLASPHLRAVALLTVVTFFTTSLADFQFKVIAADHFRRDELAAYFGYFNAAVGVLALGLQLFGTGRILNRAGVVGALSILPSALGLGSLGVALVPGLWAASFVKGSDALFRYSVNDATSQILYLPVTPNGRASAKAFIDSVVKPLSIGAAGLALIGYRTVSDGDPYRLAWLALGLCAVWLGVVFSLRSRYVRSLRDNLRNRKLDLASAPYKVQDGSTHRVLTRALESGDPREVLNALELLPHLENVELDNRVEALLENPLPQIRIAVLDYYKRRQTVRFANSIFRRFEDEDPKVRAAAVDAFCSIGKDKAVRSVRAYLTDGDPAVRSAAITGMIRYGGLDGVLMAAEALKQLISHPDFVMRQHAAHVLGAVGVSNFYQPVLELMSDPDPAVRREAIHAAGMLKSPEFVVPLIYKTRTPDTGREAVEALSQYGAAITTTLAKVLANPLEAQSIRCAVAKVLGRIGTPEAVAVLCRQLDEPDEELRNQLYRSLARAVKATRGLPLDRKAVHAALDREFVRAYSGLMSAEVLGLGAGPGPYTPREGHESASALLSSALSEKLATTERRIFTLLAVLYPDAEMERILAGIRDATTEDAPRRRANAVELLDNLLKRSLKRKLLPLSDDLPRAEKLKAIADVLTIPRLSRPEVIRSLCQNETAWIRACALYFALEAACDEAHELMLEAVGDPSPVVREMALLCCERVRPDRAAQLARSRLDDEAQVVRRRAEMITARAVQRAG